MECNKEEAIRAQIIAEKKMLNKDFIGARKIVLKAQQLFPDLENVSHMLTVCEVHCSAEVKVNGETDWYKILQVVPTADELTIKKQYRKLAFLLHPDKNKFGGAEAAFKLVGEANRILTDQSKRQQHDMKRGANFRTVSVGQRTQQPNRTSFTKKQPGVASSFVNVTTFTQSNGSNQPPSSTKQTFWTLCPFCGMRYEYYRTIMNRALCCQSCKKPFIAYDLNAPAMPSAAPWNRMGVPPQEKQVPATHYGGPKTNFGRGSDKESKGNVDGASATSQPWSKSGFEFGGGSHNESKENVKVDGSSGTTHDGKFEKVKLPEVNKKEQSMKSSVGNGSQKRGRKLVVDSSESGSSDSDVVVGNGRTSGQDFGTASSNPRRSTRQKHDISYNEVKSDEVDDFVNPKYKKSRMGNAKDTIFSEEGDNGANVQTSSMVNGLHGSDKGKGLNASVYSNAAADRSSRASVEPDSVSYPDPEFYDFDKERDENKFSVNQIWAIYDNLDAMPRYYALIRQVYGPKFKLRFTWLEYEPTSTAETLWYKADLPVACGSFKLGTSEHTHERLLFSHLMPWRTSATKNAYDIFPGKGEVWALFKNWDIEWASYVDIDRQYEYELVEILSDLTDGDVITVARLVKIQGFVSLFARAADKGLSPLEIQSKDVLQFSHKIPSYRLVGNEREGIPKGSLELDCASLPVNFSKNSTHKHAAVGPQNNVEGERETQKQQDQAAQQSYEYPESEFHNFEEERSTDKFEEGQIWALYSDIDKNSNYYGQISKIETERFKVHVTWLEGYPQQEGEKHWFEEQLPVGCGTFKLVQEICVSDTIDTFSHVVHAYPTENKTSYVIYPRVGEVWAVYKNWNLKWSLSDLENCDFDLVEIIAVDSSGFKVLLLRKVVGYRAVFMAEGTGVSAKTMDIVSSERLKFSHRIPAFRLTEERGGKLRGYWELDPASVPDLLLFTDSF